MSKDNADYEVGYGKPPKSGQFTAGHKRSRGARKRAAPDLYQIILEEMAALIEIREGDRIRKVPTLRALIKRLKLKALTGDHRSLVTLLQYVLSAGGAQALAEATEGLSALEKEMLHRNMKSLLASIAKDKETEG
jgi:hypothetical protein